MAIEEELHSAFVAVLPEVESEIKTLIGIGKTRDQIVTLIAKPVEDGFIRRAIVEEVDYLLDGG